MNSDEKIINKIKTMYIISIKDRYTTAIHFSGINIDGYQTKIVHDLNCDHVNKGDIVLYVDPSNYLPHFKKLLNGLDVYAYLIDVHRGIEQRLKIANIFKHIFVAQKNMVEVFKSHGHSATWLPLAFNDNIKLESNKELAFDVAFVGNLSHLDSNRGTYIKNVLDNFNHNPQTKTEPERMYNIYYNSKIVLNKSIGNDLNMRFFEAMGSGALLITDKINNGEDLIAENLENVIYYNNDDEVVEKIKFFLKAENNEIRKKISKNGRKLVIESHTYKHRVKSIIEEINSTKLTDIKSKTHNEIIDSYIYFHYWRENLYELYKFIFIKPWPTIKYLILYIVRKAYRLINTIIKIKYHQGKK